MSKLIQELKNEHKDILSCFENAKKNYIVNKEAARKDLILAKKLFLSHLKKEDAMLYPDLFKESESNTQLKTYLSVFAKDMDQITTLVINFFENYKDELTSDFSNDFAKITFELKNRIGKEERVLYKEYDKINV